MFNFIDYYINTNNETHEYVDSFEKKYNIKFPEALRTYYTEHNHSQIKEAPFVMNNIEFCVEFIMPLTNANVCVEKLMETYRGDEWIPQNLIPFAEDVDGDDYFWDSNDGKVYYVHFGNIENPIPIARSVEEFFKILSASC